MSTAFGTGFGTGNGGDAGRSAAEMALSEMDADAADFAVVFCSSTYDCEAVVAGVRSVVGDAELVGATATGEFTGRGVHTSVLDDDVDTDGVTVALVASDEMRFFTALGDGLSADPESAVAEAAAALPGEVEGYPHRTGLLFWSELTGAEEIAMLAYQEIPIEWVGGGAADAGLVDTTVFVGDEATSDGVAMALVASQSPTGVGVGQRHEPLGPSYEVTRSEGNVVYELDGEPAYEVWKETYDDVAREQFGFRIEDVEDQRERILPLFLEFNFGIRTGDDEYKIRSAGPTLLYRSFDESSEREASGEGGQFSLPTFGEGEEGALYFFEPIPEGVVLYPMTSSPTKTIERGKRGVSEARADIDTPVAGGLVFDCPCNEFVLGEEFQRHIDGMTEPIDAPIAGFQPGSGELCLRREDMRGMHESSTSVVLFPGGDGE